MNRRCSLFATLWTQCPLFAAHVKQFGGPRSAMASRVETHHIWGGKTRLDLPANLIDLNACTHGFMHRYPTEGRVACMWHQLYVGKLDWTELDECAGFSVKGWLEMNAANLPEPYRRMRSQLLSTCHIPRASTATGGTTVA